MKGSREWGNKALLPLRLACLLGNFCRAVLANPQELRQTFRTLSSKVLIPELAAMLVSAQKLSYQLTPPAFTR
jgi:hypothetical protein